LDVCSKPRSDAAKRNPQRAESPGGELRSERQHGEAFDALVRRARERLYGTAVDAATDSAAVELTKDPDTR